MPDIIRLLPDSVANQIAAGEVVQRPASVIKELLENSIDAGARNISVVIKEAGKTLIQVSDDGCGMSETDARMSFERHATSKISNAEDLFNLYTMGFRGEALPSIASVARIELKTRRKEDESGTLIIIEGGKLITHEPIACPFGTSIAVKNLFYNIPVRKNFLKTDSIEYKHILDFFTCIALVNPEIKFIFFNDKTEVYHLNQSSLKQRIVHILGKKTEEQLVPVEENNPIVKISGFVGKPDFARKTKGEQYLFVNKRYIKNPFFNHAIVSAFEGLINSDSYPFYALYLQVAPVRLDVNVHPTKTEVKFEDEKAIYSIIRSAVRKSLSQYHITPSIDFEQEAFNNEFSQFNNSLKKVTTSEFTNTDSINKKGANFGFTDKISKANEDEWKELLKILDKELEQKKSEGTVQNTSKIIHIDSETEMLTDTNQSGNKMIQLHLKYIFTPIRSGLLLIHQQYAHQRILFEEYMKMNTLNQSPTQKQLFPEVLEFSQGDFEIIYELLPALNSIGFEVDVFGKTAIVINGIPADLKIESPTDFIEKTLEDYKNSLGAKESDKMIRMAKSLAIHAAIKPGQSLTSEEMTLLIDRLFACENPEYSPTGKPVFITIQKTEIDKKFE